MKFRLLMPVLLLVLIPTVKGQDTYPGKNSIAVMADIGSGAISYTRIIHKNLQPGFYIGLGPSVNYAFVKPDGRNQLFFNYARMQLFNRFEPSGRFYMDAGIGNAIILQLDKRGSEDHAGQFPLWYVYLNPMVGNKNIKFGVQVGAGSDGNLMLFTSSPMLQYRFYF